MKNFFLSNLQDGSVHSVLMVYAFNSNWQMLAVKQSNRAGKKTKMMMFVSIPCYPKFACASLASTHRYLNVATNRTAKTTTSCSKQGA